MRNVDGHDFQKYTRRMDNQDNVFGVFLNYVNQSLAGVHLHVHVEAAGNARV